MDWYCSGDTPPVYLCEKDHVLSCLRVRIAGRPGVVLMDPGYHVALPITIMQDQQYPHSDPYIARNGNATSTYTCAFYMPNPGYVTWKVTKTVDGKEKYSFVNVIHITKPFLSGMDIAERRCLAYPTKALINRETNGELKSGLFFNIKPMDLCHIIFFYADDNGKQVRTKIPLSYFAIPPNHAANNISPPNGSKTQLDDGEKCLELVSDCRVVNSDWEDVIHRVASDANRLQEIYKVLDFISHIVNNDGFIEQLRKINKAIIDHSDEN